MIYKALLIWILIACAETAQGVMRVKMLNPRLGDHRARRIGFFAGLALILAIGFWFVPWIGPESVAEAFIVGGLWLVLMVLFDIAIGRWVFQYSWRRIVEDFDVRRGNLLAVGMAVLLILPVLIASLRGLF